KKRHERAERLERRGLRPFFRCVSHRSSVARKAEDRLGRGNLRAHLVSCTPFERRVDAKFPTTLRQPLPHLRRTLRPILGTTARHVAHSEHFIAFAHPGNESLRVPWIEPRGELFFHRSDREGLRKL